MRVMCLAAALAALLLVPVAGQDMTREKIEQAVAKEVAPLPRKHGQTEVKLAPVTWAATDQVVEAGSGLLLNLERSLAAHGIGVTPSATAVIRGTLARYTDPPTKSPALKLVLRVEIGGKPEAEVPILILQEDTFSPRGGTQALGENLP